MNSDSMVGRADWSLTRIDGPTVMEPVDEAAFLGTNGCAQYGLSAIANLALIGDLMPATLPYLEDDAAGARSSPRTAAPLSARASSPSAHPSPVADPTPGSARP